MLVAAAVVVAVGGAAWAKWSASGAGSASAASGRAIQLDVTGLPQPNSVLYPGRTTSLEIIIANPNTFQVDIQQIKPGGSTIVDAAHAAAGCRQSGVSMVNPTYGVSLRVPGKSSRKIVLPNGLRMTNASDNACQGATFRIPVTAVGRSS
jgi:hypothetical protein